MKVYNINIFRYFRAINIFVAPEILKGNNHSFCVDVWAVGIIAYIMYVDCVNDNYYFSIYYIIVGFVDFLHFFQMMIMKRIRIFYLDIPFGYYSTMIHRI